MRKITSEILRRLRALMKDPLHTGGEVLSAYIVPSCDAHNSEYLCERVSIFASVNCRLNEHAGHAQHYHAKTDLLLFAF